MTRVFRTLAFQAGVLACSAIMMVAVATATRAAPPTAAVRIENFTFKDPSLTVKAGTTVTWTNGDDIPHTVVSKDGLFKSKVLDSGDHFSFTFAKPGQYGYYCSIHPHMTGTIVVKA
jgi:plastocyanin